MAKHGENTEGLWVPPLTTNCKNGNIFNVPLVLSTLTFWTYRYQMVWRETSNTYHEMLSAEGWIDKQEIEVPIVQSLTFKVWIFARRLLVNPNLSSYAAAAGPLDHWKMRFRFLFQLA